MAATRTPQLMRGKYRLTSMTLDPDQVDALDELALARRTNRSAILREAIDTYLRLHGILLTPNPEARHAAP